MSFEETILFIVLTIGWITATVIRSNAILAEWKALDKNSKTSDCKLRSGRYSLKSSFVHPR